MAQNIRDEITRLHRRKQLNFTYHNMERMQDSESSGSEMGPDSPRRPDTPPHLRNPEKGLFTFKQVSIRNFGATPFVASSHFQTYRKQSRPITRPHRLFFLCLVAQVQLICESMLKEREDNLREQYDAVLTTKLAEQYDAFVKFTYDQIQRRFEAAPSCKCHNRFLSNFVVPANASMCRGH